VVVADFDATLARLHEHGFETRPGREHWGAPRAHAIAPGGHRPELAARRQRPPEGATANQVRVAAVRRARFPCRRRSFGRGWRGRRSRREG
jgi:hypothetical protein